MKRSNTFFTFFILLLFYGAINSKAQSLQTGTSLLDDAYRRSQLLGKVDSSVSFTSRPFFPYQKDNIGYGLKNSSITNELKSDFQFGSTLSAKEDFAFKLLPVSWKQQYDSDHPQGRNDGAMIPSAGYETLLTGGFFARYKWLSVQFMPELVMAQNKKYQGFFDEQPDSVWRLYYNNFIRMIDIPERFGEGAYQKAFWGQSSIRLTLGPVSLGLSNENLWWGPGVKNSILMSNNAPGFKHITFNTVRPVKTIIGSFEGQLVSGKLESSGYLPIDTLLLTKHKVKYKQKPEDWRYFNGVVLTYQPRWVPGLFVGATRSFIIYHNDLGKTLNDYLPVIIPMFKKELGLDSEDQKGRDQLASLFFRWVSPEAHQEIYFEYGRNDHSYDLTDFLLEPDHSGAFIVGARKMVPIKKHEGEYIDFQLEFTQLEKRLSPNTRAQPTWYTHHQVFDGYTQMGQFLGAGIGSGSNMQWLQISWVNNLKRIGIDITRVAHNEDFWAIAIKKYQSHWTDMSVSLFGEWNYKRLLFNARLEGVGSINYQFYYNPIPSNPPNPPLNWDHGKVRYNVHSELGVTYCF